METIILLSIALYSQPFISEVCSNPLTETAGEFVEIFNPLTEAIDVIGYSITDGDALDFLLPWTGPFPQSGVTTGTTVIPAGCYAILLEEDYPTDPWLTFLEGTVILTTGDHSICNGLAASSDPLTLYGKNGSSQSDVLSTYGTPFQSDNWQECDDDGLDSIPFDPGDGLSIGRYPQNAPDSEGNWFAAEPTPGAATESPPDTFYITIDSLFLSDSDPDPGNTVLLTAYLSCFGTVSPDSGQVLLYIDEDGDSVAQYEEILLSFPAWNLNPGETDSLEAIFIAPDTGWYPAVCSIPGISSRIHFSTASGINPVITELMANPQNEDQEEFIEIYYPGPGVFPLTGCTFTDGDAVDQIILIEGNEYIHSTEVVLIIDSEYQGTLDIPEETSLFTALNTTLGNGLTTNDPILLYMHGEPSLATLVSTAGTPLLFNDPLLCDDDGLDNIPFDPGDGFSIERIAPEGPDEEFNWITSQPGGSPGVVTTNEGWTDLRTDSIFIINNSITAIFSNCGITSADGQCTVFSDLNADLLPSTSEIIHQQTVSLQAGESDTILVPFSLPDSGLYTIAATISADDDTTIFNNTRHCTFIPQNPAWPVITEVLCNPTNEDCDEFIEIFFPGPGLADISNFSVTDNDAVDELVAVTTLFLTACSYALILDPEYENGSMPYDIPPGTVVFNPANTTIGDGLSGTDPVLLLLDSLAVSTYGTPWNQEDNIPFDPGADLSLERITPYHSDNEENWISSPAGPTPGSPPEEITEGVDYSILPIILSPAMGEETTNTQIQTRFTCLGTETVSQGELTVKITANGNQIQNSSPPIPMLGDTITLNASWSGCSDSAEISAELICSLDENQSNDVEEAIWNPYPTICINEIFYHETEWIELYNGTDDAISLSDLTISDAASTCQLPADQLEPDEFYIITASEEDFLFHWGSVSCTVEELDTWPSLNNSGDSLFLTNSYQALDMVPYTNQWGGSEASSLERRSTSTIGFLKSNWGTSVSNATPGEINSIGTTSSSDFLSLTPRIFNPPNTPLRIEVNLPMQACNADVKIYDVRGMELEHLYSSIVPGEVLILDWYGNGYPIGRYIVFVEAVCNGEILSDAQVVVLARPL